MSNNDPTPDVLPEQVDADGDDPGGMAFDDDLGEEPPEGGDRGDGPGYDSPKLLQQRGIGYPSVAPVGMGVLRQYVMGRWSGADLGTLAKPPRVMRAGSTPSLHNWGIAWDWRWQDAATGKGPGRGAAEEVMAFCTGNAAALGVQAVHDYAGGRYWKSYGGWKKGTPSASTGMGQRWAQWLHIERTWAAAGLSTPLDTLLAEGGGVASATATAAAVPQAGGDDDDDSILPVGPLKRGSAGTDVCQIQQFLVWFRFADFTNADGVYGPRTEAAVLGAQQAFAAKGTYTSTVDGIWGPKTCAAALAHIEASKGP